MTTNVVSVVKSPAGANNPAQGAMNAVSTSSLGAETKRKANLGANDEVLALRDSPPSSNSRVKGRMPFTGDRGRSHLASLTCPVEYQGEDNSHREERLSLLPTTRSARKRSVNDDATQRSIQG